MHGRTKVVPTIFILVMLSLGLPRVGGSSSYLDVTVSEAKNMIDTNPLLMILDVRNQSEYDSGHIKNAKLIPHTELETRISELDEEREILVYSSSGSRSVIASETLLAYGFTKVYNLLGGEMAWMDAGYPVYVRYSSIQEAINNASDEGTLFVSSGTYFEHLAVNKSLTLIGENRDTTIIDGGGTGDVVFVTMDNITISDFTIQGSGCGCAAKSGVHLQNSHNSSITRNIITNCGYGIQLRDSNDCIISGNTIANNEWPGIALDSSHRNIVVSNKIKENRWGVRLGSSSSDNVFYHNSFVDNYCQAAVVAEQDSRIGGGLSRWENGYLSGGNYWSDYRGVDLSSGPYQNDTGSDGIGDTPYFIDEDNQDDYPLMGMFSNFNGVWEEKSWHVNVISNSTVSNLDFKVIYEPEISKEISFNVAGEDNTVGFCRVMIPTELMNYPYTVLVNEEKVESTLLDISNSTHAYLYFTYRLSTKHVVIVPEFPSAQALPFFIIVTMIAVVLMKLKYPKKKIT